MENKKRKICVVTANRAEYSRGRTVIREIARHPELELLLVVMGSHLLDRYGLSVQEVESDGFPINYKIYMELDGKNPCTMAKSVAIAISDLATYFENAKPDIVVALTDRYEILGVATTAALMNILVAHIQGGEVTGTIDESVRHAITKLAHIHFPATEKSKERIIKMGELPEMIFNVGCPATDLLLSAPQYSYEETINILNSKIIKQKEFNLSSEFPFILGLQHPVSTEFGSCLGQIFETLEALKDLTSHQILMLWPNIDAGSDDISKGIRYFQTKTPDTKLTVVKHIPQELYVNLLRHTSCMFGNSSSGVRETCYFGTPTVNIGTRQQDRERGGNVIDAPYDRQKIHEAIKTQISHGRYEPQYIFGNGDAGKLIANILAKITVNVQKKLSY